MQLVFDAREFFVLNLINSLRQLNASFEEALQRRVYAIKALLDATHTVGYVRSRSARIRNDIDE